MPRAELLQTRTADVLKVVYLIFSEGHQASSGDDLLRPDLCVAGINLARGLAARLPRDPEVLGLLALLLLTDARRSARADLLARMGRDDEAARAYRTALELEPPAAERRYIQRRLARPGRSQETLPSRLRDCLCSTAVPTR